MKTINERFKEVYEPSVEMFIREAERISDQQLTLLPRPTLPFFGEGYDSSPHKIMFMGWEGRGGAGLKEFIDDYAQKGFDSIRECLADDFDQNENTGEGFWFLGHGYGYLNNFGSSYWDFNLNFLAQFYNVTKNNIKSKSHPAILKSLAFGNVDSVERLEASRNKTALEISSYRLTKQASKVFDSRKMVLSVFQPKVLLLMHWEVTNDWLGEVSFEEELIQNELRLLFAKDTGTYIYLLKHPAYKNSCHQNTIIYKILKSINSRKIFDNLPCQNKLMSFDKLQLQLSKIAAELDLELESPSIGQAGKDVGFYFICKTNSYLSIAFEFEDTFYGNFVYGIYNSNTDINIEDTSQQLCNTLGHTDVATSTWLWWKYFDGNLRDWNTETFAMIDNGEFAEIIRQKVSELLKALESVDNL